MDKREDDLDRELKAHLDLEAEEQGDANAARRALGNLTRVKEDVRDAWGWTWLERLGQDLRYALRTMRQSPGFTATAVLSLALGIGANTAIFSLIDALMLRWLPVQDPQELIQLKMGRPGAPTFGESFSYPIIQALAAQKDIFAGLCGFTGGTYEVGPPGSVQKVSAASVAGAYYETLGLQPAIGRLLTQDDDRLDAPLVAVISHGYWERQFGRNPAAVGQTLRINGFSTTIVGVTPMGFDGVNVGAVADITMALGPRARVSPDSARLLGPGSFWLRVLARPRKGVSVAQVKARLATVWPQLSDTLVPPGASPSRKKAMSEMTFEFAPGGTGYTYLRGIFTKPLLVLMGVVSVVLLIACANVANLQLARAAARQREIAVRLALGAGRGRIIRQLLTESTLLSLLGAGLGVCLAWPASQYLLRLFSAQLIFDLTPNWHVLAFTSAVAISTGILFGLAPAFQTTASGSSPVIKDDSRMSRSRSRLLSCLVSAQVALSLLLLIGAGLFARTLQNLRTLDPGFQREGVLVVSLNGEREGYRDARLKAFYKELLDQTQSTPGVLSASISNNTPLSGGTWTEVAIPKGQPMPEEGSARFEEAVAHFISVGPRFFETLQTPLVAGREFTEHDQGNPSVAIVNESFARLRFPNQNPVGQFLTATINRPPVDLEIVGVVRDTITDGLRTAAPSTVYVAYWQGRLDRTVLVIRAQGSLSQISTDLRKELQPKLPGGPVEISALTEQVEATLVQERLMAKLATGFGALALVLACVGLYGLLAYSVARRTKEMGIRMALGAQRRRVISMVVKGAIGLVVAGIAFGLPAAWIASRWVESMLFGITPTDPATITGAAILLAMAALLAAYLPARRASRVDPITALRHD